MKRLYPLLAAITFFTRIPVWKVVEIPGDAFRRIIPFWPLTGWITGGITALVVWGLSHCMPLSVAVIAALALRVMLTGALHEDGLGDFFDGFGGGRDREGILRIMKDSHAGSYAIVGLIFYYLLLTNSLAAMPVDKLPLIILAGDPFSKMLTAFMINFLPYSRPVADSKSKTVYDKLSVGQFFITMAFGLIPFVCLFSDVTTLFALLLPLLTALLLFLYVKHKIGGYTGDICGATALLCELMFYVGFVALL